MSKTYKQHEYRVVELRSDGPVPKYSAQVNRAGLNGFFFGWTAIQEWRGFADWRTLQPVEFYSVEAAEKAVIDYANKDFADWEFAQRPKFTVVKDLGKLP